MDQFLLHGGEHACLALASQLTCTGRGLCFQKDALNECLAAFRNVPHLTSQCSDFLGVLTVDAVDLVQQSLSLRLLDPKLGQITAQQLPAALLEHLFGLVQFHIQLLEKCHPHEVVSFQGRDAGFQDVQDAHGRLLLQLGNFCHGLCTGNLLAGEGILKSRGGAPLVALLRLRVSPGHRGRHKSSVQVLTLGAGQARGARGSWGARG
mmetsp:Transcript_78902/g.189431  ORF Transcript_78902/g.189431 Transcript_78902/m.189431 type:complete len:207 (-) Transcript_78902:292-912(-)